MKVAPLRTFALAVLLSISAVFATPVSHSGKEIKPEAKIAQLLHGQAMDSHERQLMREEKLQRGT
ncbi:hypothetical protein HK101_003226, partial [Irineochytrium annulatum]